MKTIIEDNEVMDHFPSDGIKIQYVFITISNSSYNKVFQRNDLYYGIPFFFSYSNGIYYSDSNI